MIKWKGALVGSAALLAGLLLATAATAQDTEDRLLKASESLQMPGSEADSAWWFVAYPGEDELPSVERFSELAGCDHPEGGVTRSDFDATFEHLANVQPWMDGGQGKSARGFARLQKLFHRRYEGLAVYRCETGTAEVHIYFVGVDEDGLSGLLTVNIET
ncbi:MAG TPA: nuclease A inhibitor family protein [Rubrobacter sp.]|nr:nuclease A inhibitor family protein [Rubrobacter sp.]